MALNLFDSNGNPGLDSGCFSCGKYFTCKDENKGAGWTCQKFIALTATHTDDLLEQAQTKITLESTMSMKFVDDEDEIETFESMINDSLKQSRFLPQDLSVDDSDISEAKNYYDWTYGMKGTKFRPFARQLWMGTRLFGEACPYCSDPDWYNNILAVPVDFAAVSLPERLVPIEYGKCSECGRGRAEMFNSGKLDIPQELTAAIGQRGGKSQTLASLIEYHLHKLLKTVRPSEYYGLAASTTLTHTCTALQFKRAVALLWVPIKSMIEDSSWFQSYHKLLTQEGNRLGQELFVVKDTFINWKRSRLMAAPAAPNVGTLRGDTRVGAAIDELGLFKFGAGAEDYVTISADEIHASLANALATVRTAASKMMRDGDDCVIQGMMYNISSPISVFDKIMTLVRSAKNSRVMIGVHLPTWEINPGVTRKDLQIYWDTNAARAERDFGANPPLADSPFFGDPDKILKTFAGVPNRVSYKLVTNPKNQYERGAKILATRPLSNMNQTLMTIDAGEVNNSFALCVSLPVLSGRVTDRPKPNSQGFANTVRVDTRGISRPKHLVPQQPIILNADQGDHRCIVLACLEIIPSSGGRINFSQVYKNVLVPLLSAFNVGAVVTDRWNSILMLDQLHDDHNVATFQYSLRYSDFIAIKSYIEGGMVLLPKTESVDFTGISTFDQAGYPYCFEGRPIDHLALQFQTVQDGLRTITKGPNLTDDAFRCVALAVHYLRNTDFVTQYLSGNARKSGMGGGLVAAPGQEAVSSPVVSMSGSPNRALVAMGTGGDAGTTFARTKR